MKSSSNTLFDENTAKVEKPKKEKVVKEAKTKKVASKKGKQELNIQKLFALCSAQEIMEYFDWGFFMPPGLLHGLLDEKDIQIRFETLSKNNRTLFYSDLIRKPQCYGVEFLESEVKDFVEGEEFKFSKYPIPTLFIKKIHCWDEESKLVFSRLWEKTDHDSIDVIVSDFKEVEVLESTELGDLDLKILDTVKHIDRCLGAICFTRAFDPFIIDTFKGSSQVEEFSNRTCSKKFASLIYNWASQQGSGALDNIKPYSNISSLYPAFISKIATRSWSLDERSDILLKAISEKNDYKAIIDFSLSAVAERGEEEIVNKFRAALNGIEVGVRNINQTLENDDFRKPFFTFLLLLSLHPRKGKIEMDSNSIKSFLFDRAIVRNPKHLELIATLFGYYTGYHNLRKTESMRNIGGIDITSKPRVLNAFRVILSPNDKFESNAFKVIYNNLIADCPGLPSLLVQEELIPPPSTPIIIENTEETIQFTNIPVLGENCFELSIVKKEKAKVELSKGEQLKEIISKYNDEQRFAIYLLFKKTFSSFILNNKILQAVEIKYDNDQISVEGKINLELLIKVIEMVSKNTSFDKKLTNSYNLFFEICKAIGNIE